MIRFIRKTTERPTTKIDEPTTMMRFEKDINQTSEYERSVIVEEEQDSNSDHFK